MKADRIKAWHRSSPPPSSRPLYMIYWQAETSATRYYKPEHRETESESAVWIRQNLYPYDDYEPPQSRA